MKTKKQIEGEISKVEFDTRDEKKFEAGAEIYLLANNARINALKWVLGEGEEELFSGTYQEEMSKYNIIN